MQNNSYNSTYAFNSSYAGILSILTENVSENDINNEVENYRQKRPFEIVMVAMYSNIEIMPLQNSNNSFSISLQKLILNLNINVPNYIFPFEAGDRILLYRQTDRKQNGIWTVMSIVSGYLNIQRPPDYADNTPIRPGQCVLVVNALPNVLKGAMYINTTSEYDSNQNKIISYNGKSSQYWTYFYTIYTTFINEVFIEVYEQPYQGGQMIPLYLGRYPTLSSLTSLGINTIRSFYIYPNVKVNLYSEENFQGSIIELRDSYVGDIQLYPEYTGPISSVKVWYSATQEPEQFE